MGEAAALALRYFREGARRWEKKPGDPVTEADYAVDALLRARLTEARPDYGWLSEETADSADRLARRRVWVVDPIDGTRDFIRGRTGWAVSAALVEDGRPVLARLAAPALGSAWAAAEGAGAMRDGVPCRVSERADPAGARVPADSAAARRGGFEPAPKPNALALRLAMVADGAADAFVERRAIREYDVAAATLIALEAGAAATDGAGRPLVFNQPRPRFDGVLAANPALRAALAA